MAEDAFERFRRLRGIAQEGEAPVSPLALLQQLHALGVILTPSPDGTVRCRAPQGILIAMELFTDLRASGAVVIPWVDHVRIAARPGPPTRPARPAGGVRGTFIDCSALCRLVPRRG